MLISNDVSFGAWLKQRRKGVDLTQEALAELAGCSTDMVRKIEGNVTRPSRQLTELLLASLKVLPEEQPSLITWARTGQASAHNSPRLGVDASADTQIRQAEESKLHNPYKGLRAFQERDAGDFFGREPLITRLVSRMFDEDDFSHFLAVVGPSGSGKSSVVRAGLLPALRRKKLPGGLEPLVVDIVPGIHPFEELEAALLRVAVNPPATLMEQLKFSERGLARAVKRILPADERIGMLLVIDQFEELFTLTGNHEERAALLSGLFEAVTDPLTRLWVVVTLRADFYDHPLMYLPSSQLVGQRTEVVGPLTQAELHQAIVGPAEHAGLRLEGQLAAMIIADVADQPGVLPLLQYALTELYERREGRSLTVRAYKDSGGVLGSLANRAESLFTDLTSAEQAEARQLLLRLVTLGEGTEDTRRRARLAEVSSAATNEEALGRVLDLYGRYRLLTFDRDPVTGAPTVEVAHEALLSAWPRLQAWLDAGREAMRVQRRLMMSASEWQSAGQDASFLSKGVRLAQFEALSAGGDIPLTKEEQTYVAVSSEQQRQEAVAEGERHIRELAMQKRAADRLRFLVAGLMLFLFLAGALSLWALNRSQAAEENNQLAQINATKAQVNASEAQHSAATAQANFGRSEAQRLAADANVLVDAGGDPQLSALMAIRSLKDQYSPQGDRALLKASTLVYPRQVFPGQFAAFSPDGKYLLSSGSDPIARLWDIRTGKQVLEFTDNQDVPRYGYYSASFSPDSKHILVTVAAYAQLRAVDTGKEEHTFRGHYAVVGASAFSHDGKLIVTGSADTTAGLWDVQTEQELHSLEGHEGEVHSVAFSPDDKFVATGSADNTARLWDTATGEEVRQFIGHAGGVRSVAFSPDGKVLVTGSDDGTARLWDSGTGRELYRLSGHSGSVNSVVYSPDGKNVLTGGADGTIRTWDSKNGQELGRFTAHRDAVGTVAFSPDGESLLSGSADNTIKIWDAHPNLGIAQFSGHTGEVYSMDLSSDHKYLVTSSQDKTARMWNISTGEEMQEFTGHTDWVLSAVFSPDNKYVVTGSKDKTARVWDARTGKEVVRFVDPTFNGTSPGSGPVSPVIFSPDGKTIVTGDAKGLAILWDIQSGEALQQLSPGSAYPAASFSPDGKYLVTGLSAPWSNTWGAEIWDVKTGEATRFFNGHSGEVTSVGFSRDGKYVLTGSSDKTVRLWDAQTGKELRRFEGHTDVIVQVALSLDGNRLLSAGLDNTVRVWDVHSGQEMRRFDGEAIGARRVRISSDGLYILASHADSSVSMWPIDYQDTAASICKRLLRNLTNDERVEYDITEKSPTCPR